MSQWDDVAGRFWCKVSKSASGCWMWTGAIGSLGYGRFRVEGRTALAHRACWLIVYGAWPDGVLLHLCDSPACVRPDHLRVGTQRDNIRDAMAKGRLASGERNGSHTCPSSRPRCESHGRHKLTVAQVLDLRAAVASGLSLRAVAAPLGISYQTASKIARGERWRQ